MSALGTARITGIIGKLCLLSQEFLAKRPPPKETPLPMTAVRTAEFLDSLRS
jgi:hypothetical protein